MKTRHVFLIPALILFALLAGMAPAQSPAGGVAASTSADGSSVLLRWSLPDNTFPRGGFLVTRTSSASSTARFVASPMPREEALGQGVVDEAGYDFVLSVFGDGVESELIRAVGALSAVVRPELARAAGMIHEDTAVRSGTAYAYRVQTVSGQVVGEVTVTAGTPWEPQPVTGVRAMPASAGVSISWDVPDESALLASFNIYRTHGQAEARLNADPVFMPVAGGSGSFHTDDQVEVGETYAYRVEGVDLFGRPVPLSESATVTVPDPDAVASPEPFDTEAGQLSVTLGWPAVTDSRISALGVHRRDTPGGEATLITQDLLPPTATAFTDEDVQGGTSYYYSLVAYDAGGRIAAESTLREGRGVNRIPPAAPAGVRIEAGEDGLVLSWEPSVESDVAVYRVHVSRGGQDAAAESFSHLGVTSDTSFRLDVDPGTLSSFSLSVSAMNSSDVEGPRSDAVTAHIIDTVAPDAPRLRNASATDGGVLLSWEFALDPDVAAVNVYRSSAGGELVLHGSGLDQADRSLMDSDVTPGETYSYAMTAVDHSGNESDLSPAMMVTLSPEEVVVASAGEVSASLGSDGVRLNWAGQDGVTWFVLRARAGQDRFVQIAGPLEAAGYTDTRGQPGDLYRVRPLGPDGQVMDASEPVSVQED